MSQCIYELLQAALGAGGTIPTIMSDECDKTNAGTALEARQGGNDGSLSQLPCKCYLEEVASLGDRLKICPWVTSRVSFSCWCPLTSRTSSVDGLAELSSVLENGPSQPPALTERPSR